jgi:3-hydroxyacyl-CoA dehydrogenase
MKAITNVVVLGANGTMGAGSAALFAARGFKVGLLARTIKKAQSGFEAAKKAVRADAIGELMTCGSYEEDLVGMVGEADLIIEAVTENLAIKRPYFERIDQCRRPGSIIGTVSSGLSIEAMAAGRSDDFRRHFMGIHLYNPPNVMAGTELIPGPDSDTEIVRGVSTLLRTRLGRVVVECRDMPAFAGNRIGFKVMNECAQLALEHGVPKIDYLLGPYTGRAMPPLATIDLVGLDVHQAIVDNVAANTSDEAHANFEMPAYMSTLIENGHLGAKTADKGGFYGPDGTVIDPASGHYVAMEPVAPVEFVEKVKALHFVGRYREAMQGFLEAEGADARLAQRLLVGYVSYALNRVGPDEVVDRAIDADAIMAWGFNWVPASALVDLWGRDATINAMEKLGLKVPRVVQEQDGRKRMFTDPNTNVGRYFNGS